MKKNKLSKFIKIITLTAYCTVISFTPSFAQEFIIGVEEVSYYPLYDFSITNESKQSFSKELLATFFKQHNYPYRFMPLPIKRFNKWYEEKGIDFKFPDNVRWREDKRNKLSITFSQSVIKLMAGTYVLKSNTTYKRNDIKKLGTIFGFDPTLWLKEVKSKKLELIEESSPFSIVKHVLHGNVDATNIDANVIRHNLNLLNKPNALVLNTNIKHEVFSYHLSSIKHPKVIIEFNNFIQNHPSLLRQLKKKYGITEEF
jgi:hypothetical protein